jgi:hypothetical protein
LTNHPDRNPLYSKADYIRNAVFAVAKMHLTLYLSEGANLHEAAVIGKQLQECIHRAYYAALQDAGLDVVGKPPDPPPFGMGLSDDNPFIGPNKDE